MAAKLSPKMQSFVDAMTAGTHYIISSYGRPFDLIERREDGKRVSFSDAKPNRTFYALIERGILVQDSDGEWVLASTLETPEEIIEVADENPVNAALPIAPEAGTEVTVCGGIFYPKGSRPGIRGRKVRMDVSQAWKMGARPSRLHYQAV